jgi:hypothetical protein
MANELVSILRNLLVNFESQNVSTSQSANFLEICRAQERAIEQERRDEELQRELEAVEHRNFEGIRDLLLSDKLKLTRRIRQSNLFANVFTTTFLSFFRSTTKRIS